MIKLHTEIKVVNHTLANYASFCNKQTNYFRQCIEKQTWLNIAEGGKRAGKNVLNILAWCTVLETHPDKLHLASGVSVATAKLNIIDSNGFGVLNYFKGRCRQGKYQDKEALIINTATGEKVILIGGGGKNGDEKLVKGFTLGSVYVTEANECAQPFIKEIFDRTLSSSDRKVFFDLNPKNPNHWFYEEIVDMHKENSLKYPNYGYNYEHFTLHDNFSFTDDKIREIIRTYSKKSTWYQRDILGLRTSAEGVIYDMFNTDNQYEDGQGPVYGLYHTRYYAIDYGTINPFVCLEIIEQTIEGVTDYYVENEYYYDSRKHNKQKTDSEYAEELFEFIDEKKYRAIIIDPSASSFKAELRKRGMRSKETEEIINANNEVLNGIRLVATILQAKKLRINKTKCPNTLKEFSAYIWNSKSSERGVEEPVKESDHGLDALRYYCKTIIKKFRLAS